MLCLLILFSLPVSARAQTGNDRLLLGIVSTKTTSLNPLIPVERETQALNALVYESLVEIDDDYMPQPRLCEKWESSQDGSTWTFTLREGIVFQDGSPMTAADVVATVNEILRLAKDEGSANKGAYASLQYFISKIASPDERTVVITTGRKNFGFLYAMNFPVLPASYVQYENPPGSGPYMVMQFQPSDYLLLSANPNWWGGRPAISEVSVVFHATNRDLISSFEFNRVDAVITRSMTAAQYRSGVSSFNLNYRTRQLEALLFNFRAYELEDIKVRKAIRAALNLDSIADNAYMGMAQRTDTPLPSGTWMYRADEAAFRQNIDLANQLLDEAGWKDTNGDGIRDKVREGKPEPVKLSLRFPVYEEQDNSVRVNAANQIASQLMAVGIEARVTVLSFQDAYDRLKAGNFDLALASFNMDFTPDPGFLLISGNTGNFMRYKNTQMDRLFNDLRKAMGKDNYQAKLFEIQELFTADCPMVCLYYRNGAILTRQMFTAARDIREPDVLRGIEEEVHAQ